MKLVLNNEEPIFIQIARAIEDEILSNGIKKKNRFHQQQSFQSFIKLIQLQY